MPAPALRWQGKNLKSSRVSGYYCYQLRQVDVGKKPFPAPFHHNLPSQL